MNVTKKETVLVVDDEPQVLVALEDLLSNDYVVVKSGSGENAIRAASELPEVAVVLSDQRMPQMSGDQLLAELQRVSDASRVLVTGYADLGAVVRAVNDGRIFAYVNKPWDPQALKLTVDKAAEHFRLQRDLARERRLLNDLMDSVPDGIFMKDHELRYQRVNRAYLDLWLAAGRDPSHLVGQRMSDVWPDPEAREVEAREAELLAQGERSEDELYRVRREGGFRWFSRSVAPLLGPQVGPERLVGIVRDVTERTEMAEALRASEERQRLVIEAARAGLFDWDQVSGQVLYSPEFASLLGEEPEALGSSFAALVERLHPEDAAPTLDTVQSSAHEEALLKTLECRLRVVGRGYRWFQLNAKALLGESGRATRLVGAIHDITDRKEQEARIAKLSRVRAVLGEVNGAVARVRERGALLQRSCEIAVRVGEIPLAVVCGFDGGETIRVLGVDGHEPGLIALIRESLDSGSLQTEPAVVDALLAGRPLIVNDREVLASTPLGPHLSELGYQSLAWFPLLVAGKLECVLALLTKQAGYFDKQEVALLEELASNVAFALEHQEKSQRLNLLLSHDELTGLARRELFVDRLQQRLAACDEHAPYLAVLWLDLNRFRHVNETLGRAGGDALLREVARRLQVAARESDLAARVDANAFAVMSEALADDGATAEFLKRVRHSVLDAPFRVDDVELRLSATVGVAMYPADGADAEVLLFHAETAGKAAKENGQPYLFYTAAMNARVSEKLAMETRLRRAIEEQQFVLHLQPKVQLDTGKVVGLEGLIRWQDPEAGLIPPGSFIPLLEETGLILDVGRWVLQDAARQYSEWQRAGLLPPRIAVNVSAIQLAHDDFLDSLLQMLDAYPEAAKGIDLEITESVVMGDFDANVEKLAAARRLGLGVALDDFGTGYSSLGYLRRLPADTVKIDRSFVARMDQSAADMAIVSTVISLAHSLGLRVVAEGVETTNQAHLLRLLRCDEIQGFLISKPLPAEHVVRLLREQYSFGATGRAIG